jgi:hypothetical protein
VTTRPTVAIKVLRPGIRERFAQDIDTYEWSAAQLEDSRRGAPAAPAGDRSPTSSAGQQRALTCAARPPRPPSSPRR